MIFSNNFITSNKSTTLQGVSVYQNFYLQGYNINSEKINSTSTHCKVYWYSEYFICEYTILIVKHFHKCSTFWKVNNQSIQQASDLLSISYQYTAQHSSSLWSSVNFRALSRPSFQKPLIFYQFHINIQPTIHQASDLISI